MVKGVRGSVPNFTISGPAQRPNASTSRRTRPIISRLNASASALPYEAGIWISFSASVLPARVTRYTALKPPVSSSAMFCICDSARWRSPSLGRVMFISKPVYQVRDWVAAVHYQLALDFKIPPARHHHHWRSPRLVILDCHSLAQGQAVWELLLERLPCSACAARKHP